MGRTHKRITQTHLRREVSQSHTRRLNRPPALEEMHQVGERTREWMVGHHDCPTLHAHGIAVAGRSEARPGFSFVRHKPKYAQALICESGRGRVWVDGGWKTCGAGTAYLTPPDVPHAYHALAGDAWEVTWVLLEPKPGQQPAPSSRPLLITADPRPMGDMVRGLYLEMVQQTNKKKGSGATPHYAAIIDLMVQRLFLPWHEDRRLAEVWEEVDGDLAHPWDASSLAERAGFSEEQFRRRCVRALGHSPMRHLAELRMRRAVALLRSSREPVASIATAVGYHNQFAFSTAFRRIIGTQPTRTRNEPP